MKNLVEKFLRRALVTVGNYRVVLSTLCCRHLCYNGAAINCCLYCSV
jgi:hypothetical protein